MRPVLQVTLLGIFRLRYDSEAITPLTSARLQSLFAFIILHRESPISRQQLAAIIWPESSETQARTNLRNLIHQLRHAIPFIDDFIRFELNSLEWRNESPYSLDVEVFERRLAINPGHGLQRETLEQALGLYGGELLPGCYEDWIGPIRDRLNLAYLSTMEALADMTEAAREYPAALDYTRRLVGADPLNPTANRQLIRLHALLGDRPAALKAYQAYAGCLWLELKTEPDLEIQDLYRNLKEARGTAQIKPAPASTPLIGRQAEWRQLLSAWQNASGGHSQVVFISGEAGIGKTRLVEELGNWARQQGIQTAAAFCYPAEGSLPYAPVVSWLRAQALPKLEKPWLAEIGRLLPEIQQNVPGLPRAEPIHETWQRQRLFEALARAVLARQLTTPSVTLLLVLEDCHWADQDTLEWLHFLLRFAPQAPFLIAATLRSGEIAADHPLVSLQTALRSEGRYTELELKKLNESETIQLTGKIMHESTGQALSAESAGKIFYMAEGNPLFVIEMLRLGQPPASHPADREHDLVDSEKVQAVLSRRIGQLSPATRDLTALAAAIGRAFRLDVLRQASGENDEIIVEAIDELLLRHIIQEIAPDSYDFTHDLLRQAAFTRLSNAHHRLLHRRVAEAYQQLDSHSAHPRNAEIASHYEHAGLLRQAITHHRLAAESDAGVFANADALHHLQRAVELAEKIGIGETSGFSIEEFAYLVERLGDLLALDGQYQPAQACFERALAQSFPSSAIWRSKVYRKISDGLVPMYQHALSHAALGQAERTIQAAFEGGSRLEKQEWLQIRLNRIQLFYWDNHPDQMEALIRQITPMVDAAGRFDQQITLFGLKFQVKLRLERYRLSDETVEIARRRLILVEQLNHPFDLAFAQFQLGFGLLWHGDPPAAYEWLTKGYDGFTRMGVRIWQIRSLAYLAIASRKLNQLTPVREESQQLLELSRAIGEYTYHGIALANLGWLAWQENDFPRAERLCQEAIEVWRAHGSNVFHGLADWVLLAMAVSARDMTRSSGYVQALLDLDPNNQPLEKQAAILLSQAHAACQVNDGETAFAFFNQALEEARATHEL